MSHGKSSLKEQQTELCVEGTFFFSLLFAFILKDMSDSMPKSKYKGERQNRSLYIWEVQRNLIPFKFWQVLLLTNF